MERTLCKSIPIEMEGSLAVCVGRALLLLTWLERARRGIAEGVDENTETEVAFWDCTWWDWIWEDVGLRTCNPYANSNLVELAINIWTNPLATVFLLNSIHVDCISISFSLGDAKKTKQKKYICIYAVLFCLRTINYSFLNLDHLVDDAFYYNGKKTTQILKQNKKTNKINMIWSKW